MSKNQKSDLRITSALGTILGTMNAMRPATLIFLLTLLLLTSACRPYYFREHFRNTDDLIQYSENVSASFYLKLVSSVPVGRSSVEV